MNLLELAQRTRQECRVPGSGPLAVTGQTADYTRILTWCDAAWQEIQRSNRFWRWMRQSASCATVNAQPTYSATDFGIAATFGRWALDYASGDTFRNYDTAAGITSEVPMWPMDYDDWRDTYLFGASRTTYARPAVIALAPNNSLACGPIPAAGYTLIGDYYTKPTSLTAADDEPEMPEQFHLMIVYKAMQFYGMSEAAPEVYDAGVLWYKQMYVELTADQAPRYRLAGALA